MAGIIQGNGFPIKAEKKILPNDPCPCGSGKKSKKCCGMGSGRKYFYSKLNLRQKSKLQVEKELQELRSKLSNKTQEDGKTGS